MSQIKGYSFGLSYWFGYTFNTFPLAANHPFSWKKPVSRYHSLSINYLHKQF